MSLLEIPDVPEDRLGHFPEDPSLSRWWHRRILGHTLHLGGKGSLGHNFHCSCRKRWVT